MRIYEVRIVLRKDTKEMAKLLRVNEEEYLMLEDRYLIPTIEFTERLAVISNISSNYIFGLISEPLPSSDFVRINKETF